MCLSLQSYYLCGKDSHFWFLLYSLAHNSVVMTAVLWNYQKSSSCCSVAKSCPTLCIPMDCSMLGFPGLLYFPELKSVSIESVIPSNHLILCHSLLLLLSIFPSIRVFSNESALHIRWPKYWHFSFSSVSHQLLNNPSLLICQQGREFYFPKCPWIFSLMWEKFSISKELRCVLSMGSKGW